MTQNRRNYQRVPLDASVSFRELSFHKAGEAEMAHYKDVSGGGLLLESAHAVPLGVLLKLEIRVPGWGKHQDRFGSAAENDLRPLVALGEVVRVEKMDSGHFELGVKFCNVYPDDLASLMRFVDALSAQTEA
ncbi:MAG TPA: PilZ domain-containing protein [Holophagaceae bacterium]|nr:PilZ domain-containing protein [Holophagaceae bacterium]HJW33103.1 PilZ domain-containing protein [Holophagaceae bacterium]